MAVSITLTLPPEKQFELEQLAAEAGVDVTQFILDSVEERLGQRTVLLPIPHEKWRDAFRSWLSSHRSRNPQFDDSRDSIYD